MICFSLANLASLETFGEVSVTEPDGAAARLDGIPVRRLWEQG
jgi:hypothetical protein